MENSVININRKIISNIKNIEVQGDIIVPDIKPDIVSIVNTNAIPYIYKEEVLSGRVRIEGNIDTYVVYLADNGENRSIGTTLTFIENIEERLINEESFVKQKIILENIESKVLNERKISIKAELKVISNVYEKSEIQLLNDFDNINDIQKLKENIDIRSIVGEKNARTSIKEDISVDESYNISEILKASVDIINIENKISINKVLAKADAEIKILFLAEDGRIGVASASLPIMSFIDIDKITEKNICNTEYSIKNMLFKVSNNKHAINVQIEFEVSCEVYEIKNIEVIQDMYGINNNISYSKKETMVQTNDNNPFEKIAINEKILIEDIIIIYDVLLFPKVVSINKSGTNYNYECELNMTIYYEADNRNGLNVKNVTLPFMFKMNNDIGNIDFMFDKKIFTINGENVNCEIDIIATNSNSNFKKISVIENVEISSIENEEFYKMIVYFVKPEDTAWSIAKAFRIPVQELLKQNGIESEKSINTGDRLYIMR